ncbi:MAG: hypothetical protein U1E85_07110 [Rhodocyclaceae bacterium]
MRTYIRSVLAMVGVVLLTTSVVANATMPLMDFIEYEGSRSEAWPSNGLWLELPKSDRLTELRGGERCSAIGGPRANWHVTDNRLWLSSLYRCSGKVPLESVYGGKDEAIFAEWITGRLNTYRGKRLCSETNRGLGVHEWTITFVIDKGIVTSVVETNNAEHPAVATIEDLRKILGEEGKKYAEEIMATTGWECLSPSQQQKLRGAAR